MINITAVDCYCGENLKDSIFNIHLRDGVDYLIGLFNDEDIYGLFCTSVSGFQKLAYTVVMNKPTCTIEIFIPEDETNLYPLQKLLPCYISFNTTIVWSNPISTTKAGNIPFSGHVWLDTKENVHKEYMRIALLIGRTQ